MSRHLSSLNRWCWLPLAIGLLAGCQEDSPLIPESPPPPPHDVQLQQLAYLSGAFPPFDLFQDYLYYLGPTDLVILDLGDPANPDETGRLGFSPGAPNHLRISGNRLFVQLAAPDSDFRIQMFDLGNPADPVFLGEFPLDHSLSDLTVSGNTLYLTSNGNLVPVDITDPADPVVGGSFPSASYPAGLLAATGDGLYVHESLVVAGGGNWGVPSYHSGLSSWSISEPMNPQHAAYRDSLPYMKSFESDGPLLIFNESSKLRVWNPTTSSNFRVGGMYQAWPGVIHGFDLAGGFAYLALGETGIQIVDLSDPVNLVGAGSHDRGSGAVDLAASDTRLGSRNRLGDLEILDLSSPATPDF